MPTVKEIYKILCIPPNLEDHMLRVTKIILYIKKYWSGPNVDWDNLVKASLLHDVGNIVRFKFNAYTAIYGKEVKRLAYWKKKQKEIIAKYGSDDHQATRKMLREINVDPKIVDWILSKSFANAEEIASSGKWEDKILLYSDMRVLPLGIGSLKERFDELKKRRKEFLEDPSFSNKIKACFELESQVQKNLSVKVTSIANDPIFSSQEVNLLDVEL